MQFEYVLYHAHASEVHAAQDLDSIDQYERLLAESFPGLVEPLINERSGVIDAHTACASSYVLTTALPMLEITDVHGLGTV
jgi:hypothetical protein